MHHKFVMFPFSALVGQELMKKALLLNAVDPSIGGVLIRGDKGTGKSTAVRALAHTLPQIKTVEGCPFNCHTTNMRLMCKSCQERFEGGSVLPEREHRMEIIDMPLSATEDMVIGTIDIKRVLSDGIKALDPGILARANRNLLYIDEVNLLDDHLINILLDASAMGVNIIEREGISLYHPARFILVGTMNPEEGNLRPQILDRFGLCVEVNALEDKDARLEVIRRRKAFDRDGWAFEQHYHDQEEELRHTVLRAQQLLGQIAVDADRLEQIVTITSGLGIKTHRADIVIEKTAAALAAIDGRSAISEQDIIDAALLALPHRMRQMPFEREQPLDRQRMEQLLNADEQECDVPLERDRELHIPDITSRHEAPRNGAGARRTDAANGLYLRARRSDRPGSVAVDATVRTAVRETGVLQVLPEHLMEKIRRGTGSALYVLTLDTSGSMRMDGKVRIAKSLAWHLLKKTYEQKNSVALITFRGDEARLAVEPTRDYQRIDGALEEVPAGGKTPLTPALLLAADTAARTSDTEATVIVISDGRANVFRGQTLHDDLPLLATAYEHTGLVCINAESPARSIGMLEELAAGLNAPHLFLENLL